MQTLISATPAQKTLIHYTELVYGPYMFGMFFNLILHGVSCSQFHFYIVQFPKDRMWIKLFLWSLFITSTANTAVIMYVAYVDLIKNFGLDIVGGVPNKGFPINSCITGIIATQAQLFYAWRIHKLSKRYILTILVTGLALAGLVGAFGIGIILGGVASYAESDKYKPYAILWIISAVVCDVLIAMVLVVFLRSKKSGIQATDNTVDMIISLTVRTGLVTAVTAVFELIAYLVFTTNGAHMAFGSVLAKFYVNMVFSSLNSRRTMGTSSERGQTGQDAISLSAMNSARVFVTVESHRQRDRDPDLEHDSTVDENKVNHGALTGSYKADKGGNSDGDITL